MEEKTGILAKEPKILQGGFSWDEIKEFAMNLKTPFDSIEIHLSSSEQKTIQDCVKRQADFDSKGKSANLRLNDTKIRGANWK